MTDGHGAFAAVGLAALLGTAGFPAFAVPVGGMQAADQPDLPRSPRPQIVDVSIPFAAGATVERTDARSVLVFDTYQAGVAAGWSYRVEPDGSAVFSQSPRFTGEQWRIQCERPGGCIVVAPDGASALVTETGGHRLPEADEAEGRAVALAYADWVLSGRSAGAAAPDPAGIETSLPTDIQRALKDRGYYAGAIDGVIGPQSRRAIRKAEADADLPETGEPSAALLERLRAGGSTKARRQAAPSKGAASGEAPAPDRAFLASLQDALGRRGYYKGYVDGIIGPRSQVAIRRAEADLGLAVTGRPSRQLLDKLGQPPVAEPPATSAGTPG